ncbi:ATP-binding protein [Kitasatospora misakiensis]|uniref:histidine kinase n=1 Tax=Kitasatospora misakiensis TaxID=67330 RepID=A0ABW0X956_9ACTN
MTQLLVPALALIALAAPVTAALLARGRAYAVARAGAAEAASAQAEQQAREAEQRAGAAEEAAAALLAEIGHLATERVAAVALRLSHPNAPIAGPLDAAAVGPDAVRALQAVLDAAAAAVTEERERVDAAARSTMRGATSKIQTLLYQIQSLVQQLQHDNDDPRLLEVDFRNEVALRRIQTVAVLCESWPGLARTDSPLAEVVVGALSRVPGYARIRVANHLREDRLAVVARAAEPVAIAVAEILANATAYSHPETDVPVTLQQGGRGALVIVDDSGIGMEEDQLRRARRLLAGPSEVLLTELGNPPRTGFAVVGRLARQYGFSCHVEPSPYGGMRAMVRIPAGLLTVVDEEQPLSVLTPLPLRAGAGPTGSVGTMGGRVPAIHVVPPVRAVPDAPAEADDGTGLPSRRRRRPLPSAAGAPASEPGAVRPVRTPEQAAARWQALQHGTGSGRAAVADAEAETVAEATAAPEEADATKSLHPPSPQAPGPAGADRAAPPRPDAAHTGAGPAEASGHRSTQTP